MAIPAITALKMWVGTLFTKDDWDFNFSQIVSWLADGTGDLVVNTVKATNGMDLDGAQITNLGAATSGSQAVTLDQANTLLNRTSYYYPFSVASGKVDSNGDAAYLQKDSDTQVTVLAGNVNPDLVCVASDGTIESVTSNIVLTVPATDGTYYIVKEKEQSITITTGSANKITIGKTFPSSQNTGDYFLDNSTVPFKGYKYGLSGWEDTPFCYLGYVTVSSGSATVTTFSYNDNRFDVNKQSLDLAMPDYSAKVSRSAGTTYSATENGYVYIYSSTSAVFTGTKELISLTITDELNGTISFINRAYGEGTNARNTFLVPIKKGDKYRFTTDSGVSLTAYFIPLVGG
mgnify:CR=1 FL=1